MSLDGRAREAAESLLRASATTDTEAAMADLMRLRARRAGERALAVGLCVALVVLGVWAIVRPGDSDAPEPVQPVRVYNGTLLVGPSVIPAMRDEAVDQATLRVAALDEKVTRTAWSPDGRQLVYAVGGKRVEVLDLSTGTVTRVGVCGYCYDLAWSVNDEIAVSGLLGGESGIEIRTPDGQSRGNLTVPGLDVGGSVAWSPDGTRLAVAGSTPGTKSPGVYVVNRDGSGATLIASLAKNRYADEVRWSPDGTQIAVLESRPHPSGAAYRLMMTDPEGTTYHEVTELGSCACLGWSPPSIAWAPDGTVLAARRLGSRPSGSTWIVTMRPDGSDQEIAGDLDPGGTLAWQPLPAR